MPRPFLLRGPAPAANHTSVSRHKDRAHLFAQPTALRTVTRVTAGARPASRPCCQSKRSRPGDDPTSSGTSPQLPAGGPAAGCCPAAAGPGAGGRPRWRRAARRAARAPVPPWETARRSSRSSAPAKASTSCFQATAPLAGRVQLPPRHRRRPSRRSPRLALPLAPALRGPRRPRHPQAPGQPCPPCALASCASGSPTGPGPGSRPPRLRGWGLEETASASIWAASSISTRAAAVVGANG